MWLFLWLPATFVFSTYPLLQLCAFLVYTQLRNNKYTYSLSL